MTYVGELGWELMVPVDAAAGVYDAVVGAGADLGVTNAGYYAIESLRLEKGFRAFGRELTPDYTPVEAGLVFATALDKRMRRGAARLPGPRGARRAPRPAPRRRPAPTAGVARGRRTRRRCCGAASWCCATGRRSARSPARPGARRSARAWAWPTSGATRPVTRDWLDGRRLPRRRRRRALRRTPLPRRPPRVTCHFWSLATSAPVTRHRPVTSGQPELTGRRHLGAGS